VKKYCRAGQVTDYIKILRMRIACWIPKATNTLPEYVILIPLQQWLRERVCYFTRTLTVLLQTQLLVTESSIML
jgi:hypothetical protein